MMPGSARLSMQARYTASLPVQGRDIWRRTRRATYGEEPGERPGPILSDLDLPGQAWVDAIARREGLYADVSAGPVADGGFWQGTARRGDAACRRLRFTIDVFSSPYA